MKTPAAVRAVLFVATLSLIVAACGPSSGPSSAAPTYEIGGKAVAGPTCPVEPASPLPGQCDPRPVAGAVLVITDPSGHEVARVTTGADGSFKAQVPAGSYTLTPQPAEGVMGVAAPIDFTVSATGSPGPLTVEYDTGIR